MRKDGLGEGQKFGVGHVSLRHLLDFWVQMLWQHGARDSGRKSGLGSCLWTKSALRTVEKAGHPGDPPWGLLIPATS